MNKIRRHETRAFMVSILLHSSILKRRVIQGYVAKKLNMNKVQSPFVFSFLGLPVIFCVSASFLIFEEADSWIPVTSSVVF